MSYLNVLIADLREKRLWPVAAALLIAVVAVPVLLSSSTKGAPIAPLTPLTTPVTQLAAYPAVVMQGSPSVSKLTGPARDPFVQPTLPVPVSTSTTPGTTTSTATSALTATPPAGSSLTGSSGSTGTSTGGTGTTPATSTPTTPGQPSPPVAAPTGLAANESYHVTVSVTNASGGLDTIDPLERLSLVPSERHPLLIELGVLKGGSRVLFAVQPGTVVSGPGSCTPGPIDCEILTLARDQVEQLSVQSSVGALPVAEFAVTAINADQFSSAAAADQARNLASAAGRNLLSRSTLSALSLFQYEPSIGAVVDLRDLSVGGN